MTMTKKFSTLIAIVMVICTFFSMASPAFAATSSSGTGTQIITVTTKADYSRPGSESITLKQTKGVCEKKTWSFIRRCYKMKQSERYAIWNISVEATDGSHTFSKTLSGGSLKLYLKPNKTYEITVKWSLNNNTIDIENGCFTSYPTWRISSTNKVSSYY